MRSNRNRLPFILMLLGLAVFAAQLLVVSHSAIVEAAAQPLAGAATTPQKNSKPAPADDALLAKSYRFESGGWIYVHLEGSPHDIGYQHGYLLAPEIARRIRRRQPADDSRDAARLGIFPHAPRARCCGRKSIRNIKLS